MTKLSNDVIEFAGQKFSNNHIINPDEFWDNLLNYDAKPYLVSLPYTNPIIIWGQDEQEALDNIVDNSDKLDHLLNEEPADENYDYGDYMSLGNAGELFYLGGLRIIELPVPKLDFILLFKAQNPSH